jgi:carbon-monoxide dehydrogenase medium subunit
MHQPETASAAIALLADLRDDAVIYSGGTELLLVMKLGLADFGHLVDVKGIPGLDAITTKGDVLKIGAAATHRAIETNQDITKDWPSLAMMTRQVANVRVRNVGTLGGNLAFGDPASDPATFLLALDASIEVRGEDGALRTVPVSAFHVGAYQTALGEADLIESIVVPPISAGTVVVHERIRFRERPAVTVTVAGRVEAGQVSDVKVAVGSVGPIPIRIAEAEALLRGADVDSLAGVATEAASAVEAAVAPSDDMHGSMEYKSHLAGVLVSRAVEKCLSQALKPGGE